MFSGEYWCILHRTTEPKSQGVISHVMVNCFACMKLNSIDEAKAAVQERAEDPELYFAIVLKETGMVFQAV